MTFDSDKLSDNWRFTETNKPVNEKTLDDYIAKYGEERALGYLDAIADVQAEVAWMLDHWHPNEGGYPRNGAKTSKMLRDFENHKKQLIDFSLSHPISEKDNSLNQKLKQK